MNNVWSALKNDWGRPSPHFKLKLMVKFTCLGILLFSVFRIAIILHHLAKQVEHGLVFELGLYGLGMISSASILAFYGTVMRRRALARALPISTPLTLTFALGILEGISSSKYPSKREK
jgi:hypothetical protein